MAAAVLKRAQLGLQQLVGAAATAARSAASGRIGGRATGGAAATQAPAITALDGAAFPGTRETFAWSPDALQDAGAGRQLLDLDASSWKRTRFVFLGCPGVGKGTYASRVARLLDVPHIAMGDLVRAEFKGRTAIGQKVLFWGSSFLSPPQTWWWPRFARSPCASCHVRTRLLRAQSQVKGRFSASYCGASE